MMIIAIMMTDMPREICLLSLHLKVNGNTRLSPIFPKKVAEGLFDSFSCIMQPIPKGVYS